MRPTHPPLIVVSGRSSPQIRRMLCGFTSASSLSPNALARRQGFTRNRRATQSSSSSSPPASVQDQSLRCGRRPPPGLRLSTQHRISNGRRLVRSPGVLPNQPGHDLGGSGTGAVPLVVVPFQSPPIKPCVRFSCTRLTNVLHRRRSARQSERVWARWRLRRGGSHLRREEEAPCGSP